MIGGGHRNRALTIVQLAEMAVILARDVNTMFALLRIACGIEDAGFYEAMLFHSRQSHVPDLAQNSGVGNKVSACRSR